MPPVGLTILHTLGLRFWEHLPVIAFATPLLIGDHDELFNAAHYPAAIGPLNRQIAVRLVPSASRTPTGTSAPGLRGAGSSPATAGA